MLSGIYVVSFSIVRRIDVFQEINKEILSDSFKQDAKQPAHKFRVRFAPIENLAIVKDDVS